MRLTTLQIRILNVLAAAPGGRASSGEILAALAQPEEPLSAIRIERACDEMERLRLTFWSGFRHESGRRGQVHTITATGRAAQHLYSTPTPTAHAAPAEIRAF